MYITLYYGYMCIMCVFSFVLLGAHGSRLDYEFLITSHKVQLYLWTLGAHYYTSRLWVRNEIIISPARRRSINMGWMCAGGVADHAGVDLQLCAVRFSLSLSLSAIWEWVSVWATSPVSVRLVCSLWQGVRLWWKRSRHVTTANNDANSRDPAWINQLYNNPF
jgi:hypothetical protein